MSRKAQGYVWGAVSLVAGVVGILAFIALFLVVISGLQQLHTNYAEAVPYAIGAIILLPVAYVTHKAGKQYRQ